MAWLVWSFNSKNDWKSELKKVVFCGDSRFRILISNILSITFSLVAVNLSWWLANNIFIRQNLSIVGILIAISRIWSTLCDSISTDAKYAKCKIWLMIGQTNDNGTSIPLPIHPNLICLFVWYKGNTSVEGIYRANTQRLKTTLQDIPW